jgi:rhodanese-related sulfurtransferase
VKGAEAVSLSPKSTMGELLEWYPGAQRVLFARWHVGGCSSCGFEPRQTIQEVLSAKGVTDVEGAVRELAAARAAEAKLLLDPAELQSLLKAKSVKLVDLRPEGERRIANIEGDLPADEKLIDEIFDEWPKDAAFVLYCHRGDHSLAAACNLLEQGFSRVRALRGGIDAWSEQIDPLLPRY